MSSLDVAVLVPIKDALLHLKPTGPDGFEGLLAAILSDITAQPFRLASSGSQRGRDGESVLDAGATYFEAKLYQDTVPRNAVSTHLIEISLNVGSQIDTWILCATSQVSAQDAALYRTELSDKGIGCLILDWSTGSMPLLAALLALAPGTTLQFLRDHLADVQKVEAAKRTLDSVVSNPQFVALSNKLKSDLQQPTFALGLARKASSNWLKNTFSSRRRAHQFFGQPLAPLDTAVQAVERRSLVAKLSGAFSGKPDGRAFLVMGEEGTGKSWLVAHSWSLSNPAPLMTVFTADELRPPEDLHDIEALLIRKLVLQTGGDSTDSATRRWKRRFGQWRASPAAQRPYLTVWVDGLNQAPDFPWARWIDAAAQTVHELNGTLILTTRTAHFAQRLRTAVQSKIERIIVEDWSPSELKAILTTKAIESDRLSADVFTFLRNPRILGIAIELLNAQEIETFEELNVNRLLLEHIRRCEIDGTARITTEEFIKELRSHAGTIIDRMVQNHRDDLKIIDAHLDARIKTVASSRFFEPVSGDPDSFAIKDEGLPLALGFWLIDILRTEHRNYRDPAERLGQIIEPILALDRTAEVLFAAVLAACLDESCPPQVTVALVQHYLGLQNVPADQNGPLRSVVKKAPQAFLLAVRESALSDLHVTAVNRFVDLLREARTEIPVRDLIANHAGQWLACYSLSPERMLTPHHSTEAKAQFELNRAKRQTELEARLNGLSSFERALIDDRLKRQDEGDLATLHRLALVLLAGQPLANVADALVCWAFSDALNSSLRAPSQEFMHLIQLNLMDWDETRKELLRAAAPLEEENISEVGRWSLVNILQATGDLADSARAEEIFRKLTASRAPLKPWREVEQYCLTDPCDPSSTVPENVVTTATHYLRLDVTGLHRHASLTSEDHFLSTALAGLARFQPNPAIEVHRRLVRDVLARDGPARYQGILAILPHSAIFEPDVADALISAAADSTAELLDDNVAERDEWITAQYSLYAAFPHKSGTEQLGTIAKLPTEFLLLLLLKACKPADAAAVEKWLEQALASHDGKMQVRVVSFLLYSRSGLTGRSKEIVAQFLSSSVKLVRTLALAVATDSRDHALLKRVIETEWDARALDPTEDPYQLWYGSSCLLAAAEAGLINSATALDRMSLSFVGFASERLPDPAIRKSAEIIDTALAQALRFSETLQLPAIEQSVPMASDLLPPLPSVVPRTNAADLSEFVEFANGSAAQFEARQKHARIAVQRFNKDVTTAEARLLLDAISFEGIENMLAFIPTLGEKWKGIFLAMTEYQLRSLHLFAVGLARALSSNDSASTVHLWTRIQQTEPLIQRFVGSAKIPAEAIALWSKAHQEEIKVLCFQRLEIAGDDHAIAVEVLAAQTVGKAREIGEYVNGRVSYRHPASHARALTAAGFMDENELSTKTLEGFSAARGFIGQAYTAARYAYDRNRWSRYWYLQMSSAKTTTEFWRYSVLFLKIVDGRYTLWQDAGDQAGDVFKDFWPTLEPEVRNRLQKWKRSREQKLFGEKPPHPVFL